MEDYITKKYIEELEIDKMIYEDKELYSNIVTLKEQMTEDASNRIVFATITIVIGIIKFIWGCRPPKDIDRYRTLDNRMSEIIRKLTGDERIKVYLVRSDTINAFTFGTPDIYYTDKFIDRLRITENELIAVCLHEHGHIIKRHVTKSKLAGTATGIIIPILLRELVKELPMFITFIIGKIISGMVNARLRIFIDRPQEYFSDSYAAKKGYGKPLASVLNKLEELARKIYCKDKSKEECEDIMNIIDSIDEHPITKKRIENILNSSKIKSIISGGRFELLVRFLDRIKGFFRR